MWIVHWKIGGATGHGKPVTLLVAALACENLNSRWGDGSHWMEEV